MAGLGCAAEDDIDEWLVENGRKRQGINGGLVPFGQLGERLHVGLEAGGLIARGETAVGQRFLNNDAHACFVGGGENGRS